jgi:predicted transcriptional regulator
MARSSITCSDEQREEIYEIKRELKKIFGYKPTDRDLVNLFLEAYKERYPFFLAERLEKIVEELSKVAINVSDYEKLRQENEELRKEVEELRRELEEAKSSGLVIADFETAKKVFCDVLRKEVEGKGGIFDKELKEAIDFLEKSVSPAQLLLRIHKAFIEPVKVEEEERTRRANSDAEIRYGGRLW